MFGLVGVFMHKNEGIEDNASFENVKRFCWQRNQSLMWSSEFMFKWSKTAYVEV